MKNIPRSVLVLCVSLCAAVAAGAHVFAGQDPSAAEAALDLDRPTRRSIQQGLSNGGFDPGSPDGLFGPRTRSAIRGWQEARGAPATGYLDARQAELLRAAGTPRPAATREPPAVAPPAAARARVEGSCEEWNTEEFFETATVSDVTACLAGGADVAARDEDDITPLHWAAWSSDDAAVVRRLLAAGAETEARNDNGRTPLHNAAINNENPAVVEALLAAGADVTSRDDDSWTPLHRAAGADSPTAVIEALLRAGAGLEEQLDSLHRETPLALAVWNNENPAVLEALLAAGADRAWQARDGRTLLHLAAWNNGSPEVVEALLAAGADVTAPDGDEDTPLHAAAGNNENPAVVEALLRADPSLLETRNDLDLTPLLAAAEGSANPDVLDVLLAAGADQTVRTPLVQPPSWMTSEELLESFRNRMALWRPPGRTLLHVAAQNEHPAVIRALLDAGADVSVRADDGRTPLHVAAHVSSNPEVAAALLDAGANIEARDEEGRTPLNRAAAWNLAPVISFLAEAGADLETRRADGWTPLHEAAGRTSLRPASNAPAIEALVAAGANLEARDQYGWTPLHHAAAFAGEVEMVETLIAAGANPMTRDESGETPLHLAIRYNDDNPAVIEPLLAAGADVLARDEDGRTPWDLAERNEALRDSDMYSRLNDARFNTPRQESRRPSTTSPPAPRQPAIVVESRSQGPGCEIPGYPSPSNLQNLGLSWCSSSVDFQRRAFALQAAGGWCAIDGGSSSTPEQINARHQEINAACDTLDAFAAQGGPSCRCPAGYRP